MSRALLEVFALSVALPGCALAAHAPEPLDALPGVEEQIARLGVHDGRARFREIYCAIRRRAGDGAGASCGNELHILAGEPALSGKPVELSRARLPMRVLVVPGLYGDCIPVSAFSDALPRLEALGHETGLIRVPGFSSVSANAARIRDAIVALDPAAGEPVVIVGYSKGIADALEALAAYPEVGLRVKAIVSIAGVVSGSPLADKFGSSAVLAPLARLSSLACRERDLDLLSDLGTSTRRHWLSEHRLPDSVLSYSLVAFDERDGISRVLRASYDALAKTDPRNDGAMVFSDAIVPGSKLLGFVRADHWAVALPVAREMPRASALGFDRNEFPREALLEAVVRTVEEDLLARR